MEGTAKRRRYPDSLLYCSTYGARLRITQARRSWHQRETLLNSIRDRIALNLAISQS